MSEAKDTTIALNVRLKPVDQSNLPHQANYSNVGVTQGIAYLDFCFIEPALLGGDCPHSQRRPSHAEGHRWPACHPCRNGCGCTGAIASAASASADRGAGC